MRKQTHIVFFLFAVILMMAGCSYTPKKISSAPVQPDDSQIAQTEDQVVQTGYKTTDTMTHSGTLAAEPINRSWSIITDPVLLRSDDQVAATESDDVDSSVMVNNYQGFDAYLYDIMKSPLAEDEMLLYQDLSLEFDETANLGEETYYMPYDDPFASAAPPIQYNNYYYDSYYYPYPSYVYYRVYDPVCWYPYSYHSYVVYDYPYRYSIGYWAGYPYYQYTWLDHYNPYWGYPWYAPSYAYGYRYWSYYSWRPWYSPYYGYYPWYGYYYPHWKRDKDGGKGGDDRDRANRPMISDRNKEIRIGGPEIGPGLMIKDHTGQTKEAESQPRNYSTTRITGNQRASNTGDRGRALREYTTRNMELNADAALLPLLRQPSRTTPTTNQTIQDRVKTSARDTQDSQPGVGVESIRQPLDRDLSTTTNRESRSTNWAPARSAQPSGSYEPPRKGVIVLPNSSTRQNSSIRVFGRTSSRDTINSLDTFSPRQSSPSRPTFNMEPNRGTRIDAPSSGVSTERSPSVSQPSQSSSVVSPRVESSDSNRRTTTSTRIQPMNQPSRSTSIQTERSSSSRSIPDISTSSPGRAPDISSSSSRGSSAPSISSSPSRSSSIGASPSRSPGGSSPARSSSPGRSVSPGR